MSSMMTTRVWRVRCAAEIMAPTVSGSVRPAAAAGLLSSTSQPAAAGTLRSRSREACDEPSRSVMIRLADWIESLSASLARARLVQVECHLGDDQTLKHGVVELECLLLALPQILEELGARASASRRLRRSIQ